MDTELRLPSHERGESLLELLIAVAIMGIAIVAIVGGIGASIVMSDIHRKQAAASDYLHNYAEQLDNTYVPCPSTQYASTVAPPAGFASATASVAFWDTANFTFDMTSCPGTDPGLQQITLRLATTDGMVHESLVIVLRKQT